MEEQRILKLAVKFFEQRGIRATSMSLIAHELGISKATIYELFENKTKLLIDCIRYRNKIFIENVVKIKQESATPVELLVRLFEYGYAVFNEYNPSFYDDLKREPAAADFLEQSKNTFWANAKNIVDDCVEQKYFNKIESYKAIVKMFASQFEQTKFDKPGEKLSIDEFYYMLTTFISALCTPKGIDEINRINKLKKENNNKYEYETN